VPPSSGRREVDADPEEPWPHVPRRSPGGKLGQEADECFVQQVFGRGSVPRIRRQVAAQLARVICVRGRG
jgi:hypothetical protein